MGKLISSNPFIPTYILHVYREKDVYTSYIYIKLYVHKIYTHVKMKIHIHIYIHICIKLFRYTYAFFEELIMELV